MPSIKNIVLIATCYLLFVLPVAAQHKATNVKGKTGRSNHNAGNTSADFRLQETTAITTGNPEMPGDTTGAVICHSGYTLSYNERHEQANWVAYKLKKEEIVSTVSRTNDFMTDPYVTTGSADNLDYDGQGYDRGHLAPAGDFGWSATAMAESFYYSNISPQLPAFNRGVWKRLEELVRFWATTYDSIYIVTGPVLTPGLPAIGFHHVSVPHYYYKVILRMGAHPAAIGFVLPNQASAATLKSFAVSIDSVEKLTGINFFSSLPNAVEDRIESTTTTDNWRWTRSVSILAEPEYSTVNLPATTHLNQETATVKTHQTGNVAVQCSGTTKSGKRCQRMTTNASGRCWQH